MLTSDILLAVPLAITLLGAGIAALAGLPAVNGRLPSPRLGWLLALAPLAALGLLLSRLPALESAGALGYRLNWLPSLGLGAALYFDHLSALFAFLVTGIGALVMIYAGYYFKGDPDAWRFFSYMMLFKTAMLGVVLAGDVITLFIFWEATSVTSFLLIAYKYKDEAARRGAFKSLLITGGGGVALLVGLLLVSTIVGSADFVDILNSGELLRQHSWYLAALGLFALGAFSKSAQVPAHIWLPDAMSAPTPASAYLHSATMVKAGIYLMARFNPVLGKTEPWFWVLSLFGLATMLTGAYLGLKQKDLKALLAYSTISQLGVLMMLIGQETEDAFKALVIGILAHALYKSALFLVVGIVDHETGTRNLDRLGGIGRAMPFSLAIGSIAALSMAGLPPLFGFLAKETLLAAVVHPSAPELAGLLFTGGAVLGGALLLAQAGILVADTFLGQRRVELQPHEAPAGMLLAPAIPALLSLLVAVLPEPAPLASLLAGAAAESYGDTVKVSLALWTGLNLPLALSLVAITIGVGLFVFRRQARAAQARFELGFSINDVYDGFLRLVDAAAYLATRLQVGRLRHYLAMMLLGMGALILALGQLPFPVSLPAVNMSQELVILRAFTLLLVVASAAATLLLRRDLLAILAMGASGLSIAVLFVLEPAPDLALVMIVVDILTVVIMVLALRRLPRTQRLRASEFTFSQSRLSLTGDLLLALGSGLVMAVIVLTALISRPRETVVTPYYEANAKLLAGATDIVGAIVIDFRSFDTLIEIVVFSLAGVATYTLLRYASRVAKDRAKPEPTPTVSTPVTRGIGGLLTSPLLRAIAYLILPLALIIAVTHIMYGHDQPGDGFTAGTIISLAVGFWYVVFGYNETKQRLTWLRPAPLIGVGLLLALLSATTAALINGAFFSPVDFGRMIGISLPAGFYLSTSFLFEVSICLTVLGGATYMIDTLGHPENDDPASESEQVLYELNARQKPWFRLGTAPATRAKSGLEQAEQKNKISGAVRRPE